MKYKVGDRVWRISQCYPGKTSGTPTGTPYRCFVKGVDKKNNNHLWLGTHDDSELGSTHTGISSNSVHHNLFELIKRSYQSWHLNSPIDTTWAGSSYIDKWRDNK